MARGVAAMSASRKKIRRSIREKGALKYSDVLMCSVRGLKPSLDGTSRAGHPSCKLRRKRF